MKSMLCLNSCFKKFNHTGHVYIIEESEHIIKIGHTTTTKGRYPIYPQGLNTLLVLYTNNVIKSEEKINKYCCTCFEKKNDRIFSTKNINQKHLLNHMLNISLLL